MLDVLVISNIPTPYNDALFREVERQGTIRLHVAYCADREANRSWTLPADKAYSYEILPGHYFGGSVHVNPAVASRIARHRPSIAVLSGSYTVPTLQMAGAALVAGAIPWLYWGEQLRFEPLDAARRAAREAMRWLVRRSRGVLAIGRRAVASYVQAGVPPSQVANFHYYPDLEHFQLTDAARAEARERVRARLNFPSALPVFVFCGQLIPLKGVDVLLEATAVLRRDGVECGLVIAGDGPSRAALEERAAALGIAPATRMVGFVQPAALPEIFAAGDVFVLPSRKDGWGLVVPEAMAAGLPVIASDQVNAALELVDGSSAGWIFPVDDVTALADRMRRLCRPGVARTMGQHAQALAASEAPASAAARLAALVNAAAAGGPQCNR